MILPRLGKMALLDEAVWRTTSRDFRVCYEIRTAIPPTRVFAMANVPIPLQHGSQTEGAPKAMPPEGVAGGNVRDRERVSCRFASRG